MRLLSPLSIVSPKGGDCIKHAGISYYEKSQDTDLAGVLHVRCGSISKNQHHMELLTLYSTIVFVTIIQQQLC